MIVVHNHLGGIEFTRSFFVSLITGTIKNCYGVADINASNAAEKIADKLPLFGRIFDISKGVNVKITGGKVCIAVHISVMYGVNVSAVVNSVRNKIRYAVEEQTGLPVDRIDIYIDGLTT